MFGALSKRACPFKLLDWLELSETVERSPFYCCLSPRASCLFSARGIRGS
jgi:hypothetical protein